MSTKNDDDRDLLIFELIKKKFDDEWERLRSLDNKANNLIGFVSVAVSFLLGTGSLGFFDVDNLRYDIAMIFVVGVGILILSIIIALFGIKIRKWSDFDISNVISEYKDKPYRTLLRRSAATMAGVVNEIESGINDKARFINWSWYLTIAGLVIVFIFTILAISYGITVNE